MHPPRSPRRTSAVWAAALTAAAVVIGPSPALALAPLADAGTPSADGARAFLNDGAITVDDTPCGGTRTMSEGRSVTLVTGDTVTVLPAAGPCGKELTSIEPAEGREGVPYATLRGKDGHVSVVPADAQPLLAAGRVDPRLFDVTGLLGMKYGDDERRTLPLIADGAPRSSPAAARSLPTLGFTAGAVAKPDLGQVWKDTLADDDSRLWLDGRRKALDETSTRQIGAPHAWSKGLTGKGVTVAVLDSGADANHPDLAGAISVSKDFTGTGEGDGNGHGTHVAATVAGRGSAYPGAAPGASLAIGKVLDSAGRGSDSSVLAGMEWAAKDVHADVVSMSLGGTDTQGTDPLEAAVDTLSATTGTLFVIAAGNSGAARTISSPGSADAALTVGAVDSTGALASFSSRGPRTGDYGVKPEIAAPGVDITAAAPGGGYATMSGTSMATPHVAGAAAILAQQHPDWTGQQLKDALVGSASGDAATAFETGAGQLDVAAAVDATVTASPSNTSTEVPYGTEKASRTVTYRNDGDRDVTLALAEDADALYLDRRSLRVPAHGTASVDLRIGGADPGSYAGVLTARAAGGGTVRTVVGAYIEPEAGDLTVRFIGFDGQPLPGQEWQIVNMRTGEADYVVAPEGTATVHLPAGEYTMPVYARTKTTDGKAVAVMANVPVTVRAGAQTVTVDARETRKLDAVLDDDPAAKLDFQALDLERGIGGISVNWSTGVSPSTVTMVPPAQAAGLSYRHHAVFVPSKTSPTKNWRADTVDVRTGEVPAEQTHHASLAALTSVRTVYRSQAYTGNNQAVIRMAPLYPGEGGVRLRQTVTPPAAVTTHYVENAVPGLTWVRQIGWTGLTGGGFAMTETRALADGEEDTFGASALGPVVAAGEAVREGDAMRIRLGNLLADPVAGHRGGTESTGTLTLDRGTDRLATGPVGSTGAALTAEASAGRATYRLTLDQSRSGWILPTSARVTTEWTFRSGHTGQVRELPLTSLRIEPGGLDGGNGTPYGSELPVVVRAESPDGGPQVTEVTSEASFDGGTTWVATPLSRGPGGSWAGTLVNPESGPERGGAALRVTARDAEGGTVTQTVLNAYRFR
ncbi:S8 family serine peptidase [Streptomyces sp. NBC_00234]|uniref:S8 family peptidase n=1 Tax=Streptomyces sp. NBC_00234 TaxID=2903638 RepID=UPI002E2BDF6A|nr:S8 family serine peptidase [Streptomyces sp. NBC_00234]